MIRRGEWNLLFDDRVGEKVPDVELLYLLRPAELLFLGGDDAAILAAKVARFGLADWFASLTGHNSVPNSCVAAPALNSSP